MSDTDIFHKSVSKVFIKVLRRDVDYHHGAYHIGRRMKRGPKAGDEEGVSYRPFIQTSGESSRDPRFPTYPPVNQRSAYDEHQAQCDATKETNSQSWVEQAHHMEDSRLINTQGPFQDNIQVAGQQPCLLQIECPATEGITTKSKEPSITSSSTPEVALVDPEQIQVEIRKLLVGTEEFADESEEFPLVEPKEYPVAPEELLIGSKEPPVESEESPVQPKELPIEFEELLDGPEPVLISSSQATDDIKQLFIPVPTIQKATADEDLLDHKFKVEPLNYSKKTKSRDNVEPLEKQSQPEMSPAPAKFKAATPNSKKLALKPKKQKRKIGSVKIPQPDPESAVEETNDAGECQDKPLYAISSVIAQKKNRNSAEGSQLKGQDSVSEGNGAVNCSEATPGAKPSSIKSENPSMIEQSYLGVEEINYQEDKNPRIRKEASGDRLSAKQPNKKDTLSEMSPSDGEGALDERKEFSASLGVRVTTKFASKTPKNIRRANNNKKGLERPISEGGGITFTKNGAKAQSLGKSTACDSQSTPPKDISLNKPTKKKITDQTKSGDKPKTQSSSIPQALHEPECEASKNFENEGSASQNTVIIMGDLRIEYSWPRQPVIDNSPMTKGGKVEVPGPKAKIGKTPTISTGNKRATVKIGEKVKESLNAKKEGANLDCSANLNATTSESPYMKLDESQASVSKPTTSTLAVNHEAVISKEMVAGNRKNPFLQPPKKSPKKLGLLRKLGLKMAGSALPQNEPPPNLIKIGDSTMNGNDMPVAVSKKAIGDVDPEAKNPVTAPKKKTMGRLGTTVKNMEGAQEDPCMIGKKNGTMNNSGIGGMKSINSRKSIGGIKGRVNDVGDARGNTGMNRMDDMDDLGNTNDVGNKQAMSAKKGIRGKLGMGGINNIGTNKVGEMNRKNRVNRMNGMQGVSGANAVNSTGSAGGTNSMGRMNNMRDKNDIGGIGKRMSGMNGMRGTNNMGAMNKIQSMNNAGNMNGMRGMNNPGRMNGVGGMINTGGMNNAGRMNGIGGMNDTGRVNGMGSMGGNGRIGGMGRMGGVARMGGAGRMTGMGGMGGSNGMSSVSGMGGNGRMNGAGRMGGMESMSGRGGIRRVNGMRRTDGMVGMGGSNGMSSVSGMGSNGRMNGAGRIGGMGSMSGRGGIRRMNGMRRTDGMGGIIGGNNMEGSNGIGGLGGIRGRNGTGGAGIRTSGMNVVNDATSMRGRGRIGDLGGSMGRGKGVLNRGKRNSGGVGNPRLSGPRGPSTPPHVKGEIRKPLNHKDKLYGGPRGKVTNLKKKRDTSNRDSGLRRHPPGPSRDPKPSQKDKSKAGFLNRLFKRSESTENLGAGFINGRHREDLFISSDSESDADSTRSFRHDRTASWIGHHAFEGGSPESIESETRAAQPRTHAAISREDLFVSSDSGSDANSTSSFRRNLTTRWIEQNGIEQNDSLESIELETGATQNGAYTTIDREELSPHLETSNLSASVENLLGEPNIEEPRENNEPTMVRQDSEGENEEESRHQRHRRYRRHRMRRRNSEDIHAGLDRHEEIDQEFVDPDITENDNIVVSRSILAAIEWRQDENPIYESPGNDSDGSSPSDDNSVTFSIISVESYRSNRSNRSSRSSRSIRSNVSTDQHITHRERECGTESRSIRSSGSIESTRFSVSAEQDTIYAECAGDTESISIVSGSSVRFNRSNRSSSSNVSTDQHITQRERERDTESRSIRSGRSIGSTRSSVFAEQNITHGEREFNTESRVILFGRSNRSARSSIYSGSDVSAEHTDWQLMRIDSPPRSVHESEYSWNEETLHRLSNRNEEILYRLSNHENTESIERQLMRTDSPPGSTDGSEYSWNEETLNRAPNHENTENTDRQLMRVNSPSFSVHSFDSMSHRSGSRSPSPTDLMQLVKYEPHLEPPASPLAICDHAYESSSEHSTASPHNRSRSHHSSSPTSSRSQSIDSRNRSPSRHSSSPASSRSQSTDSHDGSRSRHSSSSASSRSQSTDSHNSSRSRLSSSSASSSSESGSSGGDDLSSVEDFSPTNSPSYSLFNGSYDSLGENSEEP